MNDLDRTRCLQIRLLYLPAVWPIRVEPQQTAAGSERSGSCGPAGTLEIPRRPIAPRSTLAPHSIPNQIQSRPDDLQAFRHSAPVIWNSLSTNTRCATSPGSFKQLFLD